MKSFGRVHREHNRNAIERIFATDFDRRINIISVNLVRHE